MSPGYRHFVLGLSTLAAVGSSVVHMGTPFLIPALTATGLSLPTAGLIAAMPAAGIVVTLIAWGWFVDVFGERAALSLGLGSTAAMTGVAAWASESGAVALAGALFFAGCAAASVNSASGRVVSGWYPPSQRGTAMGIRQMAQPLGAALSAVTLPVLAATHGIRAALTFAAVLCAVLALAFLGWQMYTQALEEMPLDQKVRQVRAQESYTTFEELPDTYVQAVIAAEDHRFYQHSGIDVIAIGRALWNDLKAMSFVEGGSTITQQLAKNLYFTQEKELTRKVAEMFMAFHLEANYTKEEIFELYVNSIYFGSGCYDVASASQTYFGVSPSQMTDDQCTLLAGVPNAPSVYDPTVNPDLSQQRQRQVVSLMVKYEYLTETEAASLLAAA